MEKLTISTWEELKPEELDEFVHVVQKAGEAPGISRERVEKAACLVRCFSGDVIVGTAALKTPGDRYWKDCFSKAGLAGAESKYPLELGYVWADESIRKRGMGHLLVAAALSAREKKTGVFATSEISNFGMHRVLDSRHFKRAGKDWEAARVERPDRRLALFLSPGIERVS